MSWLLPRPHLIYLIWPNNHSQVHFAGHYWGLEWLAIYYFMESSKEPHSITIFSIQLLLKYYFPHAYKIYQLSESNICVWQAVSIVICNQVSSQTTLKRPHLERRLKAVGCACNLGLEDQLETWLRTQAAQNNWSHSSELVMQKMHWHFNARKSVKLVERVYEGLRLSLTAPSVGVIKESAVICHRPLARLCASQKTCMWEQSSSVAHSS